MTTPANLVQQLAADVKARGYFALRNRVLYNHKLRTVGARLAQHQNGQLGDGDIAETLELWGQVEAHRVLGWKYGE